MNKHDLVVGFLFGAVFVLVGSLVVQTVRVASTIRYAQQEVAFVPDSVGTSYGVAPSEEASVAADEVAASDAAAVAAESAAADE